MEDKSLVFALMAAFTQSSNLETDVITTVVSALRASFLTHWTKSSGLSGMAKSSDDQFSDKEAAAPRDAVVKRMIAMPPKPHSEMKVGKKAKKKKAKKAKDAS